MTRTIMVHGDDEHFTPEQLFAAELLSQIGRGGLTMAEIAERANTSERSLQRWRKDPRFAEYVKRRSTQNINDHLPDLYETLINKAKSGTSAKWMELVLRTAGVMNNEMIVHPAPPENNRSNAAIEAEIDRLRRELGEIDDEEETQK
ncbi:phBC6A51 family helix-turn-helix protein [Paenibacillus sp. NPDC056722]|uniref:phBC6A51 family helix-turn-helix protein n=1 Tax=Paenibacillus sp. NPDC056722 TaxID=3345924 RepID=UPI0036B0AE44